MRELDEQDKLILKELVTDPRLSDNKVSKLTGVPVKTVNRKRKKLEEDGIINYYSSINHDQNGTGRFSSMNQFIVMFRHGITRRAFIENLDRVGGFTPHDIKHIRSAYLGEYSGQFAVFLVIESKAQQDLLEIFNSTIVPKFHAMLGHDCISKTKVMYLHSNILCLHNYLPQKNMHNGNLKKDWPKDNIFVG